MGIEILDKQFDQVIKSHYITVKSNYKFALDKLVPLIDKLEFQRSPLRSTFYKRLERDIVEGCIMPPLTIAISYKEAIDFSDDEDAKEFIMSKLDNAFILDGIQRLTTLSRIAKQMEDLEELNYPLYFNILICDSMDRLLYRMVTLNNGQRPMTARHQIEILANNIFDFERLALIAVSEKQKNTKQKNSKEETMSKDVLIKGYIAYISDSINIDNQKIIESKMDELIAEQILDTDFTKRSTEYVDVVNHVETQLSNQFLKNWFQVANNFIGFSAAMSKSFDKVKAYTAEELEESLILFESAFGAIDVSKIKLGLGRRKIVKYYFENIETLSSLSTNKLLDKISQEL